MRSLFLTLLTALPIFSQADVIQCFFTEPFLKATYSMVQQKLTVVNQQTEVTESTLNNVSFQIKGPGAFELWDANRNVVMLLDLNLKGSDGMSDRVFPYSVDFKSRNLIGGCESNFLHATN